MSAQRSQVTQDGKITRSRVKDDWLKISNMAQILQDQDKVKEQAPCLNDKVSYIIFTRLKKRKEIKTGTRLKTQA